MIYGSILLKAVALVAAAWSLPVAMLCWLASMGLDAWRYRAMPGPVARFAPVALLNLAAFSAGLAAHRIGDYAAMRWKDGIPGLSHLADLALGALNLPAGVQGGKVYLSSMAGTLQFATTLDNLGATVVLTLFALCAVYLLFHAPDFKHAGKRLAGLAGMLLGIAVLRFLLFVLLFVSLCDFVSYETEELPISPFIRDGMVAALFLPLLLLAFPLMNRLLAPAPESDAGFPAGWTLTGGFALALCFLSAAALHQPAGKIKQGEVLINTFHTQWSRTDRPYDRAWYGADSGYNYACLKRWFETFYPTRELKGRITAAELEKASMIVIYVPDKAFTADEIRLVHEFVRGGGGVLLIGDHTNVFGSTSHLNTICKPFGFFFRDDVLFDIDEDFHQLKDLPGTRPGVLHGMDFFKFRGPASIQATSLRTRSILDIGHSKSVRAIYSVNNFYPPPHDDPRMMTGRFCAAATSTYGSGRVAAFADSTVFSNFEIFYPGKYEYLLNHAHWLNHRNSASGKLIRRLCGFLAVLLLAAFLFKNRTPRAWLFALVIAVIAVFLARRLNLQREHRGAEFPDPVKPANALFFVADTHDPGFALRDFASEGDYNKRYDVFVQWVLRTGAFSGFYMTGLDRTRGLYEHFRDGKTVQAALGLILRDEADFKQLDELMRIPKSTGTPVMIMASESLSAEKVTGKLLEKGIIDPAQQAMANSAWPRGEAVLQTRGGRLLLVAGAERFSDQFMGFSEKVVPNETQRAVCDQAFAVVNRLFGIEPAPVPSESVEVTPVSQPDKPLNPQPPNPQP